jgi:hypothetical protein
MRELGGVLILNKHWMNTNGWGMVNYIFISCDKVTSIDNQSWILVHAYVVEDFKRTPILVNLEWDTKGYTTNNFTKMIRNSVKGFGGLFDHNIHKTCKLTNLRRMVTQEAWA